MDLLYVTEGVPTRDPLHGDGSSMISYEVIRRSPPDVRITLITFGDTAVPDEVRARCVEVHVLPLRDFRVMAARSLLFGGSVGALQRSHRAARRLVEVLSRRVDVTLVHGPHVAFLTHDVQGPVVLQVVDPWSSRATMEAGVATGIMRLYRLRQARQTRAAERGLPSRVTLLTVGQQDAVAWSQRIDRPVTNIANGVDRPSPTDVRRADREPTICFVGSLNYPPNIESAEILISEIAPRLWSDVPEARFVIAGRHPVASVRALAGGRVEVRGNVVSVQDVFHNADVAVFPDRHGLGIRNSVSEALAAGLPVVATTVAAREQPHHPRLHISDDLGQLAAWIREELTTPPQSVADTVSSTIRTWDEAVAEYHAALRRAMDHRAAC